MRKWWSRLPIELSLSPLFLEPNSHAISRMLCGMFQSLTNYARQYVKARHHSTEQSEFDRGLELTWYLSRAFPVLLDPSLSSQATTESPTVASNTCQSLDNISFRQFQSSDGLVTNPVRKLVGHRLSKSIRMIFASAVSSWGKEQQKTLRAWKSWDRGNYLPQGKLKILKWVGKSTGPP